MPSLEEVGAVPVPIAVATAAAAFAMLIYSLVLCAGKKKEKKDEEDEADVRYNNIYAFCVLTCVNVRVLARALWVGRNVWCRHLAVGCCRHASGSNTNPSDFEK